MPRTPLTGSRPLAVFATFATLVATLVSVSLVRLFVVGIFYVPSQSMMPTLLTGDYFVASRYDYGIRPAYLGPLARWAPHGLARRLPRIGDVVIVAGGDAGRRVFVKRVMGLPGQVVAMRGGVLSVDGRRFGQVREPMFVPPLGPNLTCLVLPGLIDQRGLTASGRPGCRFLRSLELLPGGSRHAVLDFAVTRTDTFGPVRVPAGRLFLLGDNRDDSADSRIAVADGGLGMVPVDDLMGRARLRIASTDGTWSGLHPSTWLASLRMGRVGWIS